MSKLSTYSAWVLTAAAVAGGIWLLRRGRGSIPTLVNERYNMEENTKLPLGYRSNNPLNIRYRVGNNWLGKVFPPASGKYGLYERFKDLTYGYRAALVLLRNKGYILGGLNTIRKIITKWAPEDDHNYTQSYIENVSRLTGIDPDTVIFRNDRSALSKIVYAMSIVENGYKDTDGNSIADTYGLPNMEIINKAWDLI